MITQQAKQLWGAVLGQLQLQVTRPSYQTWLKDTVGLTYTDGEFLVGTPNAFVAEMLEQRMYSLISQAMESVTHRDVNVRFQVMPSGGRPGIPDADQPQPNPSHNGGESRPNLGGDVAGSSHSSSNREGAQPPLFRKLPLYSGYTFETFIVGMSNELAHAAALAVSDKPGCTYNPLVIYSDVGLGKTHLLHSIGHRVQSTGRSLIYATTEEFTNEYIKAIRVGRADEFRDRYRSADVLLLDDVQFLIGKEQTQEGFFHTFNALHMANRQIVITSDRPVSALTLLEDRIRSRLTGGLVVDIQAPDLETRLAILKAKAGLLGSAIGADVLQFLGKRVHKNIRELEGKLNRAVAYAHLTGSSITMDLVKRAISDMADDHRSRQVSDLLILDAVSSYFQVPNDDLTGRKRDKKTALARQVAMYLLKEEADLGPSAIGRALGGKDHTTVIHGCGRIASRIDTDSHLRRDVLNIREALATT